jgi:hypothetical protein
LSKGERERGGEEKKEEKTRERKKRYVMEIIEQGRECGREGERRKRKR